MTPHTLTAVTSATGGEWKTRRVVLSAFQSIYKGAIVFSEQLEKTLTQTSSHQHARHHKTDCSKLHVSPHVESFKYAITLSFLFFGRGMCLQRLGKALHVTPSQNIVVKTDKTPKIGSTVVDENLKVVGKIFDLIGPVPSPYVVVKPAVKEPEKLTNKQLYLLLSKKERS
jgi:RNA-binding protein